MRLLPHKLLVLSLQGRKTMHGYPLASPEEALAQLKELSGQNFCADADKWSMWLRFHWNEGYRREKRPVQLVAANAVWMTSNVKAFAQSIYDDRRFQDMPILADVLEEAGCDNADIRNAGEHLRGCWVLDGLFGQA